GDDELLAPLMPAGAIADEDGVGTGRDLGADLLKMPVHGLGVGVGHDHGRPNRAGGADGAEYVGGDMAVVADHAGPRADRRPDVGVTAFLAYAGLVLKPDFERAALCGLRKRGPDQIGEVFLKAASASRSFCGCCGRGCRRVSPSSCSHRPMVFSCTSTRNRRATSALRSTQRQRTTPWTSGSGPSITSSRSSAIWDSLKDGARPGAWRDFRPSIPSAL